MRKITEACDMDTTTKRLITNDELKALNIRLWKEWTLKATEVNCCKLCSSVVDDATAGQFLKYVQGYEVTPEIIGLIARIARGEYTPPGLDCTLRGKPQKNFLMYKIEPLPIPPGTHIMNSLWNTTAWSRMWEYIWGANVSPLKLPTISI